jgi:hypothetical protein
MLPDLGVIAMVLEVPRTRGEGVIRVSPGIDDGKVDRLGVSATREVLDEILYLRYEKSSLG